MAKSKLENAILITGAGQRIGAYLARQFLQQTNYPVVFTYRTFKPDVAKLIELGALAVQCDFNKEHALPDLLASIQNQVHSLRAVIHNASVWSNDQDAPVLSGEYRSLFTLHVDVPMFLNEALHPLLLKSACESKDIISISDFSVSKASETHIAYLASKAALQNLTKGFAKKFAPDIKVNDIAPALIIFNEGDSAEYRKQRLAQAAIPIEPGEEVIWQAVNYLMKSPYSTGISLPLDGGRSL